MNYEEKYKYAIEQAKKELEACGSLDCDAARQIFRLFPELAESEGERIRKEIIRYLDREITLSNFGGDIATFKEWIDWLEKQGGKKPSDKVEPKFKVDDWIVNICSPRNPYKIIEVCESWYEIIDTDDSHYSISFNLEAKDFRLWTVDDAKKGDILQANKCTLIFDSLAKDIDGNTVISSWYYCDTETFYGMGTCKPDLWDIEGVVPATKGQCDFLFQKMKNAGYEWDATAKKLKVHYIKEI